MRSRLLSIFFLVGGALVAPACSQADAATARKSSPQGFIQLVDRIAFATGDSTDLTLSPVNGDADGGYRCFIDVIYKASSGNTGFYLRPFGTDETTMQWAWVYNNGSDAIAGAHAAVGSGWAWISENTNADVHLLAKVDIVARTGQRRMMFAQASQTKTSGTVIALNMTGSASDTTTNITALTVHAGTSNSMRAGSYIKCQSTGSQL